MMIVYFTLVVLVTIIRSWSIQPEVVEVEAPAGFPLGLLLGSNGRLNQGDFGDRYMLTANPLMFIVSGQSDPEDPKTLVLSLEKWESIPSPAGGFDLKLVDSGEVRFSEGPFYHNGPFFKLNITKNGWRVIEKEKPVPTRTEVPTSMVNPLATYRFD